MSCWGATVSQETNTVHTWQCLSNQPMILLKREICKHAHCQNMAKFDQKMALLTGHGVFWLQKWFMRVNFTFRFKLSITI